PALVADVQGPGHRRRLLLAPPASDDRAAAVGPCEREEGPGVPGEGAGAERDPAQGDGRGGRRPRVRRVNNQWRGVMTTVTAPREPEGKVRFTAEQFWDMCERGYFDGKRVELIGGEVVAMPAQSNEHFGTIEEVRDVLAGVFWDGYWDRMQGTVNLTLHRVRYPDT